MEKVEGLREAVYTDEAGRHWAVLLPERAKNTDAARGIPIGPPDLSDGGWPLEFEVRLHNELFDRRLWSKKELSQRPNELIAVLQSVFNVDVTSLTNIYFRR